MTPSQLFTPSDWDDIRLVVFDVDGTLYRQRPLRLRMAREILLYTLLKCDLNVIAVLEPIAVFASGWATKKCPTSSTR